MDIQNTGSGSLSENAKASSDSQQIMCAPVTRTVSPTVLSALPKSIIRELLPFSLKHTRGRLDLAGKGTWISNSTGSAATVRYAVIQVNGKKLRDVYVRDNIGSFLDVAVGQNVEILSARIFFKSYIIGVRTEMGVEKDGVLLCASTIVSFPMIAFWGIGFPFFINNFLRMWKLLRF